MRNWKFLALLGASAALHIESKDEFALKERHNPPNSWKRLGPVHDGCTIQLDIALKSGGGAELEHHLREISDPEHSRYGQYLSQTALNDLFAPEPRTITRVEEWLKSHGILELRYNAAKDWIKTGPVSLARVERLLNATYSTYHSEERNITAIRASEWSLPRYLHDDIVTIQPTSSFFLLGPPKPALVDPRPAKYSKRRRTSRSARDSHNLGGNVPTYDALVEADLEELGHISIPTIDDISVDPNLKEVCTNQAVSALCISFLYGTLDYTPRAPAKGNIGLVNYLGETINKSDIRIYLERYRKDAAATGAASKITTKIVNKHDEAGFASDPHQIQSGTGLESALDAETLIGLTYPIPITSYEVGGRPPFIPTLGYETNINEPYLDWINYMLSLPQDDLPKVVTSSYGEPEQTVPLAYAKRVCEGFAQLGARGVSVIFASGDNGVGHDGQCFTNDGRNTPAFLPTFPATCPFVTSVGGTRELDPQVAAFNARTGYVTGGGFSNYFPRPQWQDQAVTSYLQNRLEPGKYRGLFNPGGRGFPDVSALSYHYAIIHDGESHLSDGTSAAAPTFASVIALLNDALMAEEKPPLGFLNPWIYSSGLRGFTDIVHGSNNGCNTTGFPALEGWDPVTGVGTPNFPSLRALAMNYRYREARPWYYGR